MKLIQNKLSFKLFGIFIKELFLGKSLARILLNLNLKDIELRGEVLDLGSKSNCASYNRFFKNKDSYKITFTDWHEAGEGIVKLNLEEPFSIENNKYDFITCFNVLEHVFNFNNLVSESYRVLKPGGLYIGQTPFLVNYHADPHDYFRYTHEAIETIFSKAGFKVENIVYLGYGPIFASLAMRLHIFPKIIRPFFVSISLLFDYIILRLKSSQRLRYPLGFLYMMRKE